MTKKSNAVELLSVFGKTKPCGKYLHGSCSKNAHRYEVSSRQHSESCGKDAIEGFYK